MTKISLKALATKAQQVVAEVVATAFNDFLRV